MSLTRTSLYSHEIKFRILVNFLVLQGSLAAPRNRGRPAAGEYTAPPLPPRSLPRPPLPLSSLINPPLPPPSLSSHITSPLAAPTPLVSLATLPSPLPLPCVHRSTCLPSPPDPDVAGHAWLTQFRALYGLDQRTLWVPRGSDATARRGG